MSTIQINENEIYYISSDEIDSSKPTLFMLHGAGQSHLTWEYQIEFLTNQDGYNFVIPDLPGHGKSKGDGLKSVSEYTEFTKELIDELGLSAVAAPTDPPPVAAVKAIWRFATTLPNWSVTRTVGTTGTGRPAVTVCPSPRSFSTTPAGPTKPLAMNTAACVAPGAVALSTFCPTTGPSVQLVTVAIPSALLVT